MVDKGWGATHLGRMEANVRSKERKASDVSKRDQDRITERKKDKRSGGSVKMTVRQEGRGVEGHVWLASVTGLQSDESKRVMEGRGKRVCG
jgi:hypothetical protein